MTTAIEAAKQKDVVVQYRPAWEKVLPTGVDVDRFIRVSQGVIRKNRTLAQVANKNPQSLLSALLDCARLNLEPGDTYHLVPYGNEIVGVRDYKGEIELMYRTGVVGKVTAEVVYANDIFVFDQANDDRPKHRRATHDDTGEAYFGSQRGDMVGAYAFAVFADGSVSHVVVMDRAEIMRHRDVSKVKTNWDKWPESYWRKTVIHELSKWVPLSPEYRDAISSRDTNAEQVVAELRDQGDDVELVDSSLDGEAVDLDDEIADAELVDDPDHQGDRHG